MRTKALAAAVLLSLGSAAQAGPSLLFDPKTGEVISQERAGEPWYPASLTKLMTAYVVFHQLKAGYLKPDQKITVSEAAQKQPPSKLGIKTGGTITVDLALQAMLVYSANDIAVVLAEAAGGSIPRFVGGMNAAAKHLGMTGTHFANPNGLFDERQVTTARDMALLASAILNEFPEHAHYFSQADIAVGKKKLRNRNSLLRQMETADGMKTGFVCDSGYNLVASATQDGHRLLAIVLGEKSGKARADVAEMLLTSGFSRPVPVQPRPQVKQIENAPLGSLVPADMTKTVCKDKPPGAMARSTDLTGWGISLGRYESADIAKKALRGRLLGARELGDSGTPGIVQMPGGNGFSAVMWGMEEKPSQALCDFFRGQQAYCDVLTPENFGHLAALIKETEAAAPQIAQGSDDPPPKKQATKKKRKKARKK